MSLHIWCRQDPRKASSCAIIMVELSLEQSCHRQKKSYVYACRVASVMSNSLQPCGLWPARLLSHGGFPGKNTGAYWPILVAIPFSDQIR